MTAAARLRGIEARVFDACGTLFDVHSEVGRHRARIGEVADSVSGTQPDSFTDSLALAESGLSRVALAQRLRVDERAVRRMLDPHRHIALRLYRRPRAFMSASSSRSPTPSTGAHRRRYSRSSSRPRSSNTP